MAAIPGKNTALERAVRSEIHRCGFRFRLHPKHLPGKPDIWFPRYKLAVFVNGCFWHAHRCKAGHVPKTNSGYWTTKLNRTRARDLNNLLQLQSQGCTVAVVWECSRIPDTRCLIGQLVSMRSEHSAAEVTHA